MLTLSAFFAVNMIIRDIKSLYLTLLSFLCFTLATGNASTSDKLLRLQEAYPDFIQSVSANEIIWFDGTSMPLTDGKTDKTQQEKLDDPSLLDQLTGSQYKTGIPPNPSDTPTDDPGRVRYMPFFQKMYGQTEKEVEAKLTEIYWMPRFFGTRYPLRVTTINGVSQKFTEISEELEDLCTAHPQYIPYLGDPGGTFTWRDIANTHRLSMHSFGMTIDVNAELTDYWQWDLIKEGRPPNEDEILSYKNHLPLEIVSIFEKHGFIWGGKWQHYDTMHFEYRPELILGQKP